MSYRLQRSLSAFVLTSLGLTLQVTAQAHYAPCNNMFSRKDVGCLWDSFNRDGVYNNPSIDPVFTLTRHYVILGIQTYHWNGGAGQDPAAVNGQISIYNNTTGALIGSWPAVKTYEGSSTNWSAFPDVKLGPGVYRVVDSHRSTWSYSLTDFFHKPGDGPDWAPNVGFAQVVALATNPLQCWTSGTGANLIRTCVSRHGNVIELRSPYGEEHIGWGDVVEGYVACAKPAGTVRLLSYFDSYYAQRGWAEPYKITSNPATVYRKTTDGKLELVQQFSPIQGQTAFRMILTLYNRSGLTLHDVYLDRYVDLDIANTWTGDQFDKDSTSVFGWDGTSQVSLTNESAVTSATAVHRNGTGWPVGQCNVASEPTPTGRGDWVARISLNFGKMLRGTSKTVELVYRVQ